MLLFCVVFTGCNSGPTGDVGTADNTADYEWETLRANGAKRTFQLPKPYESMAQDGFMTYGVSVGDGVDIWVTTIYRGGIEAGDEAETLATFEERRLGRLEAELEEGGFTPEITYEKDLPVENGLGQQIRVTFGDQFVLTRFYITSSNFYYVRIDNGDESNPTVERFLSTFLR